MQSAMLTAFRFRLDVMHLHILGICGTFMGGVAALAKAAGHYVTGADAGVYPPMSDQLRGLGIELIEDWDPAQLKPVPDVVVIGNALSRGNPCVEHVLANGIPYASGPQWLAENILRERWTLAVAGTHGKTTTASMLAWILDRAGLRPGFLIGGVATDFGISARLGEAPFFVVEADEYDTAFFDKRAKFVHYRPRTLTLNNLEYDHADIFPDLASIQRQFHHLVRTVPNNGLIVVNAADAALAATLEMGCWTPRETFADNDVARWRSANAREDGSAFDVLCDGKNAGRIEWNLLGRHNVQNALAAIAAARHAGVQPARAVEALNRFQGVKRRLELRGTVNGIRVYDDFAHHPTAIRSTLEGLRRRAPGARLVTVLEPRSNTMKLGVHRAELAGALEASDRVFLFQPEGLNWDLQDVARQLDGRGTVAAQIEALVDQVAGFARSGDELVIMSNGGFGGFHQKLIRELEKRHANRQTA